MLRHAQLGKEFLVAGLSPYSSMKETSFSSKLEGGFSCKYAWFVVFTNSSQKLALTT